MSDLYAAIKEYQETQELSDISSDDSDSSCDSEDEFEQKCVEYLKKDPTFLLQIPVKFQTLKMIEVIPDRYSYVITSSKMSKPNFESLTFEEFLKIDQRKYKSIPQRFEESEENLKRYLKLNFYSFYKISESARTLELTKYAISLYSRNILFGLHLIKDHPELLTFSLQYGLEALPHMNTTRDFCYNALKNTRNAVLQLIPFEFRDYEMCKLALEKSNNNWYDIPKDLQPRFYIDVAKKGMISFVPNNRRTKEIILAAIPIEKYPTQW